MLARVATFNHLPYGVDERDAEVQRLRTIIRESPGYVAGFHLRNPGGKAMSIVVIEDQDAARAMQQRLDDRPDDQRIGVDPDLVEFFQAESF